MTFPKVFLRRVCSLFYVVTDVSSVTSVVSQWFDRNFLKCLNLVRKEKREKECSVSLNPLVWFCWGSHVRHRDWNNGLPVLQLLRNQKQWSKLGLEHRVPIAHPDTSSLQQGGGPLSPHSSLPWKWELGADRWNVECWNSLKFTSFFLHQTFPCMLLVFD